MQKDELQRKTAMSEFELNQEKMLELLAKQHNWAEQERHWKWQRIYWAILGLAAIIAVIINGLKPLWS